MVRSTTQQTRSAFVVEGEYRAVTDVDTSNPGKNVFKGSLTLKNIVAENFVIKSDSFEPALASTVSTLELDKNYTNPGTRNTDKQPGTPIQNPGYYGAAILVLVSLLY